ncbi:pericentriolar material 1 protein isoform X1 [Alosa sapidissima]|uniref:pericentriolar material 1 protein isoform X1 n=1 Tax=Alosa sapidissima TaxID=34773 RepID=UPI001C0A2406|nr:pericentriolar material 1 protein isoform X1 [Alosa sapidissima]XP_041958481.1 pericentriolar material 1 protein isoform X1 [Alosa sapidissima]XP_041958482.1 pericentriolar material 1 protein isoform X1 [Alosa sapidissima]XP_041958483.1 pericentriolar material 1 protein isoform X1 [Alosa sapidissima]
MATGGASFDDCADEQELHNWTVTNGSLEDRLNNMDWGIHQKKANRSSEKNRKKFSTVSESRLTNDISPESTPGAGRRRARTPHSFPHVKYATQMSVPDQAELERLRQRINFTDLDERSIGSDSQGRVTAANNQRQLAENKKPFNFLPLHVNTNKSKEAPVTATPSTLGGKEPKKQSPGRDLFAPVPTSSKEAFGPDRGGPMEAGQGEPTIDSSQVVSKLVQIRESISKANSMRDDMLEKNDVPANVERLSHLIAHLKEQERSYLRFLQKMLAREEEDEEEDGGTVDSAVGSGSVAESTSLNIEPRSEASGTTGRGVRGEQKEELENLRKQHDLLKKMLEQQEQLRALQGRQAALLAMQQTAEQAMQVMDETVVTETTGSVSGISITSELNDELNDLIQRFHNQLHDSQTKAVPDNRRQAESLSLSREVCRSRVPQQSHSQPHSPLSPRGASAAPASASAGASASAATAKLSKLQDLQDKKETMDKILQELHSLRDQTLNNSSCRGASLSSQRGLGAGVSSERPSVLGREANGARAVRQDSYLEDTSHPADKLRKLKEVHKRLNELRELVQYYEQTSDMMVDAVNENVKDDDEETEDGSLFEAIFDSEQENREPITNIRNPRHTANWVDMNSLTNGRGAGGSNNREGRLNTDCEINNRSATNLRSLNIPSVIECQYNRDRQFNGVKDDDEALEEDGARRRRRESDGSGSSRRSSLGVADEDTEFAQKVHRLHTAKQKLRQLQELVAMVQSDDTDATTANEEEGLHQQPNNTRAPAPKAKRELVLSDQAREKLYEEKLKQQQQELKQLQEERQRLMDIQGKIQDLQRACPDLQSSVSSSVSGPALRKIPAAASTPACGNSASATSTVLKPSAEAASASVADNELWTEMRRHQIMREELRQRRKHLESLMAEQQRRSVLHDTSYRSDAALDTTHLPHAISRDERTMATWGGSTPCRLDDEEDSYASEVEAEEEEEGEDSGEESSYTDDLQVYPRKQPSYSSKKSRNSLKGSGGYQGESAGLSQSKQQQQQQQGEGSSGGRRQENLRWATDLSFTEGTHYWQEQVSQLQKQLDFSTSMCQTLLQDQQTLSYMLQTLMTGPYNVLPGSMASPQVPLIMHQLNQCYTQLAWQQSNIQRLKQGLNELLRKQQQEQQQTGQQKSRVQPGSTQDSSTCSLSPSIFLPYALNLPGLAPCSPGFNMAPMFPSAGGEFPQSPAAQAGPSQQQQDPNLSMKTEYMSFPPPLQRSTFNNTDNRPQADSSLTDPQSPGWLNSSHGPQQQQQHAPPPGSGARLPQTQRPPLQQQQSYTPSSSPVAPRLLRARCYQQQDSQESLSSMPDPGDPTTVTRTYRPGRKASAQASLASRDKTPNAKTRRRRGKGKHAGVESDSVSSTADYFQGRERGRAPQAQPRGHNQSLLDKLTQEKLDSKTKSSKPNDVSSAYAWRTPFLSNRIACTEAPDASSDFSLFEALRETIYSEVATLISQNESRPHFLIELFHELQLLNSDYLRQRALYSLQDIVTRHLTEKNVAEDQASSLGPAVWVGGSQSELTPSESLVTSDAEMSEKNMGLKPKLAADGDSVDEESFMSTSSNLEPFASDDLGNTVIHLDKALARMREYERMKLKAEFNPSNKNSSAADASNTDLPSPSNAAASASAAGLLEGSCQASGDMRCPQIDTQQLDRQIKAIMTEVIPFLKEHMDEVCSHQLLTSVRRMVLTLTQQNDESKEFVRFFHRQLGGILQDSLGKFVGRTLQECGEDLLVEISEILFNELAFFRLMQDLDNNSSSTAKNRTKRSRSAVSTKHANKTEGKGTDGETTFLPGYCDQDKDRDETEQEGATHNLEKEEHLEEKDGQSSEASEVEEEVEDEEEEEEEGRDGDGPCLSISLSKAETQPLTNYGSGEDENELEEMEEFEAGPVEVQTSLQASTDTTHDNKQCNAVIQNSTSQDHETSEGNEAKSTKSESIEVMDSPEEDRGSGHSGAEPEAQGEAEGSEVPPVPVTVNGQGGSQGSSSGSPDTESPVMISVDEVGSGNTSQKSDEDDFVKVEDLPLQLSVMSEEELRKRITEEQQNNNLTVELLNGNTEGLTGLIGDGLALKEPETVGAQSA